MTDALEIIPKDIIRTETVLSRFPIHKLSKSGKVSIEIKIKNEEGELTTKWKIKNPPDPLGYKIDTLVINRKIEEAGKPVPKLIKLGSLREIAKELDQKTETNRIKDALLQNAGALINAKFTYKSKDGREKYTEIGDTRYAVIFTGEKLPNEDKADATYILLHDIYREILNNAPTRPLDYEYLKELSPIAQRFYEIVSFQMYGALKNKRTAKMLYSEFCTYAPQTRFFDWEQVRPQMYRLHKPHLESGYIENISFEKIRNEDGTLDWLFTYVPGRKAKGEHTFAMRKPLPKAKEIKTNPDQFKLIPDEPLPELLPELVLTFNDEEENLISKMRNFGVLEKKARELVKSHKNDVEREIEFFPYRDVSEAKNAAGLFISAVLEGYAPPDSYHKKQKAKETQKQIEKKTKEQIEKSKIEKEAHDAWDRANKKLNSLPESEREKLFEAKKQEILELPENKNADSGKLKILESVLPGMIRGSIIEDFINKEKEKIEKKAQK